jgi:multiple sugar transport system permease protein
MGCGLASHPFQSAKAGVGVNKTLEKHSPFLMTVPAILILILVSAVPLVYVLAISFTNSTMAKPFQAFVGFANFKNAFHDEIFGISILNTLVFALSTTCITIVLGFILAFALQQEKRMSGIFRTVALLPLFTPPVAVAMIWRLIYDPNAGLLNYYMFKLGLSRHVIAFLGDPKLAMSSIILADVWQWTPFCFLLLFAALQALPREPYEAAAVDGTTSWQVFRRLTLPMVLPNLIVVFTFRLIISFKVFDLVYMLTLGGPGNATQVTSFYIYRLAFRMFNTGYGGAISILMLLFISVFTTLLTTGRTLIMKGKE